MNCKYIYVKPMNCMVLGNKQYNAADLLIGRLVTVH